MDKLIPNILSFPTSQNLTESEYNRQIRVLNEALGRMSPTTLAARSSETDPLDLLDHKNNSLGVLYIFAARLTLDRNDITNLWPRIVDFLANYDPRQMHIARDLFRKIVDSFLTLCDNASKPLLAVKPLKNALLRLQHPSPPIVFSYLHVYFVKYCLEARCFREALPILDVDIEEFPPAKDKEVIYADHLTYHLYGAMLYMGVKNWERAAEFLTFVVTCPGSGVSAIQVDAMKKLILVNLLLEGKSQHFPSITPSLASRAYKALVRPYETFAMAYGNGDADVLRREIGAVMESFRQDGNEGLASQCLENFRSVRINSLTHTYLTLGVEQIAERDYYVQNEPKSVKLSSDKLEGFILGMIDRCEIRASLSHMSRPNGQPEGTDCMVLFHDIAPSELQKLQSLGYQISRTDKITAQAQFLDKKLCLSKEWILHLNKANRGAGASASSNLNTILRDAGVDDGEDAGIGSIPRYGSIDAGGGAYEIDDDMMRGDFDDEM